MNVAVLTTILRAVDDATPVVSRMADNVSKKMGSVKTALIGAFSAAAIGAAIDRFADFAGQMTDLAGKTGMSTTALQGLKLTFDQAGVSIDTVAGAVGQMQRRLVGGDDSATGAMARLGLNTANLLRQDPAAAFTSIADAIGKVANPAERAKLATDAFGRGGVELLPALNGHIGETVAKFERMGLVLSEDVIAAGDDFGDVMGVLEASGTALIAQVLAPMLPLLTTAAEWFGSLAANAIPMLQGAFSSLVQKGLEVELWLRGMLLRIAELSQKVPFFGEKLGASAETVAYLREQVQLSKDTLATYSVETEKATPKVARMAAVVGSYGKASKEAAAAQEAINKVLREARWPVIEFQDVEAAIKRTNDEIAQHLIGLSGTTETIRIGILPATTSWTSALEALKPAIKDARDGAEGLGGAITRNLKGALVSMPATLTAAFLGGGGVSGAVKAIGTQVGGDMGTLIGASLQKSIGGTLGKVLGSLGGPIGAALGALGGSLLGKLGGLFGGGEGKKVNDMRDAFVASAGGIHELNVKAQAAGLTLDRLLAAKKVTDFEAAVRQLNGAFDDQEADAALLQAAIDKYGLSLADLGPKFAQGKLDEQAGLVLNEFRVLTAAGANTEAVIAKMAPSLNEFVKSAIDSGATIPREMRPILEQMARMGVLTDQNGEKLTDVANLPWGESVTESLTTVATKLDALITKLGTVLTGSFGAAAAAGESMADRVAGAINRIPTKLDFEYQVSGGGDSGFANGTLGRLGRWFGSFGGGFPTVLHGNEAVVTPSQAPAFAADVLGGGGGAVNHFDFRGAMLPDYGSQQRLAEMVAAAASARAGVTRRRAY